MSNILQDILGLFKRKNIVKSPKDNDLIALATLSDFKKPSLKPDPEYQGGVISMAKLKSYINAGASGSVKIGNTLFVSKLGNDTTASTAGDHDLSKHWLNPTVAMANAVSGDIVVVYPGHYTIGSGGNVTDDGNQQMVKDGVILYMMPGAFIDYTNLTGTSSLPFTDGGSAASFVIGGKGKFKFNSNISVTDSFLCLTHVDSTLDWEFDEIDIRKRWGGGTHDAKSWRMIGRYYINRESMIFALRNTNATTNRFVEIDIEEVYIGSEYATTLDWTRQELRSFGNGSVVNIHYGKVTYPSAISQGGFHQNTSCTAGAIINLQIDSIKREGLLNTFFDSIVRNESSFHSGVLKLTNVDTENGILATLGAGGDDNTKRYNIISGVVRSGFPSTGANSSPIVIVDTNDTITTEMDIVSDSGATTMLGVAVRNSPNHVLTGRLLWKESNPAIRLLSVANHGMYKDLVISITTAADSVINLDASTADMRVMNVYATNAISTANGGISQLIETIKVDTNV